MAKFRKQITFDLDTKELEKYYPTENWRNAYDVIKKHMVRHGFVWLQGSVYTSKGTLTTAEVTDILLELTINNPWLNLCMRDCRETNIGKEHSKNHIFDKNAKVELR